MSTSDHDTESTIIESPRSHLESPYSSPSQQVPQLAYSMTELTCTDSNFVNGNNGRPYLRILEQPQNHFRFRYKSEMVGTHGCLLGDSYATSKTKTHPTVELVDYTGQAIIRCRLAQHKTPDEHPHKLLEDEQDRDVSYEVPEHGSYKVGFAGMGIIHTAKKDVPGLLFKKYLQTIKDPQMDQKNLRIHCENEAKAIDLNIVRLRFSAHDIQTHQEICPPVFSRPIYNMKCAATNDLKICKISRSCGRASGGEDVFLLVEKVNKKNIMVRLFELNENGERTWSSIGHFIQSDVHHQYAIVFRTPPYKDRQTPVDKKVFIELVRPSDGRTSEPREFKYKAAPAAKIGKKRKPNSSYSSLSSSGSLRSTGDVPVTALYMNQLNNEHPEIENNDVQMFTISQIPQIPKPSPAGASDLGEAILYGMKAEGSPSENHFYDSPMMPQGVIEPPDLQLNSAELERILRDNSSIPAQEKERFAKSDWSEYLKLYADSLNDENNTYSMEIVRSMLISDSGRGVKLETGCSKEKQIKQEDKPPKAVDYTKGNIEYSAFYKSEDGNEVKKLVKELCEIIREKPLVNKQIVRAKLERLFEMRLSNGDTFLHMTLCSRQPSLDYIIKLIHSMKMTRLLNLTNYQSQTILHLAVIHDMPKIVSFLISKGCNPMIEDSEGNSVVHNAVICQSCLEPLLDACKRNSVSCDLNAYNNEKQTALHLAVIYKSVSSIKLLLKHGASYNVPDCDGRTALHLAAYDDCLPAALALADHVTPSEIDALDRRGYTALQVVCDGEIRENTLKMVKLLLEKKASPLKSEQHASSAWKLSKDKPAIRDVLRAYLPPMYEVDDEIKSEPEDEFESADEGESQDPCLTELSLYLSEVSDILDVTGGWRSLACKLDMQALHSWYSNTDSPTRTLLLHVKECGDYITSKVLAVILEEIGEFDAATIIRRYID